MLFLIVRGAHLAWSWPAPLAGDAIDYDHLARLTLKGEPWLNWRPDWDYQFGPFGTPTAVRSPGLPLFLALVYGIVGEAPRAARVVLVLVNAVAAGLLFDASRKAWGTTAAATTAVLWTFWPVSVRALYYLDTLRAETLAVPLIVLAIWSLTRDTTRGAVLAGLAMGAAILTRSHLALALPIATAAAVIVFMRRPRAREQMLVCALTAALCVAPWALRNAVVFGAFVPLTSQSGLALWFGWAEGTTGAWEQADLVTSLVTRIVSERPALLTANEAEKSQIYARAALDAVRARGLADVAALAGWKAWLFLRPWETFYGVHSALLLATILVLIGGRRSWSSPAALLATSICLSLLCSAMLTFYLGRYRFLQTPALLFLAGSGVAHLDRWRRRTRSATAIDRRPRSRAREGLEAGLDAGEQQQGRGMARAALVFRPQTTDLVPVEDVARLERLEPLLHRGAQIGAMAKPAIEIEVGEPRVRARATEQAIPRAAGELAGSPQDVGIRPIGEAKPVVGRRLLEQSGELLGNHGVEEPLAGAMRRARFEHEADEGVVHERRGVGQIGHEDLMRGVALDMVLEPDRLVRGERLVVLGLPCDEWRDSFGRQIGAAPVGGRGFTGDEVADGGVHIAAVGLMERSAEAVAGEPGPDRDRVAEPSTDFGPDEGVKDVGVRIGRPGRFVEAFGIERDLPQIDRRVTDARGAGHPMAELEVEGAGHAVGVGGDLAWRETREERPQNGARVEPAAERHDDRAALIQRPIDRLLEEARAKLTQGRPGERGQPVGMLANLAGVLPARHHAPGAVVERHRRSARQAVYAVEERRRAGNVAQVDERGEAVPRERGRPRNVADRPVDPSAAPVEERPSPAMVLDGDRR